MAHESQEKPGKNVAAEVLDQEMTLEEQPDKLTSVPDTPAVNTDSLTEGREINDESPD
jgi:hypothetical protein